jgi:hypothetical protein
MRCDEKRDVDVFTKGNMKQFIGDIRNVRFIRIRNIIWRDIYKLSQGQKIILKFHNGNSVLVTFCFSVPIYCMRYIPLKF